MKKLSLKEKKNIKNKIIKGVNITCYVCTAILLLLGLLVGVNSCNDNKNSDGELNKVSLTMPSRANNETIYYYDKDSLITYFIQNGEPQEEELGYSVDVYVYGDVNNIAYHDFIYTSNTLTLVDGFSYDVKDNDVLYTYEKIDNYSGLNITLVGSNFTLGDIYPYAYFGGYENDYFLPRVSDGLTFSATIFKGLFYVNGLAFNEIKITYATAIGTTYGSKDNFNTWDTPNYFQYVNTIYLNNNGGSIIVNKAVYEQTIEGGNTIYTGGRYWVDTSLKNLNIVYYLNEQNDTSFKDYSYLDLLKITPNYNDNLSNGNGGIMGNLFTIIASAFSAFGAIFSLAIAPGITIGTLILLPILVALIFLIVKIARGS